MDSARDVGAWVQLETDRLRNPGLPGQLAPATGHRVDTALTVAQQEVLLGWLRQPTRIWTSRPWRCCGGSWQASSRTCPSCCDALDKIGSAVVEARVGEGGRTETVDEQERAELEEALRRLAHHSGRPDQQAAQHTARPRQPGPDYARHAL